MIIGKLGDDGFIKFNCFGDVGIDVGLLYIIEFDFCDDFWLLDCVSYCCSFSDFVVFFLKFG